MIQILTKEWEITKEYIYEVALQQGIVQLDINDFLFAVRYRRPLLAVKVEDEALIPELCQQAFHNLDSNLSLKPSVVILNFVYGEDNPIHIEEMQALMDIFQSYNEQNIEIKWGLQSRKEFAYQRQVQLFAFGRETVEVKEIGCTDALQVWGTTFHGVEELMQYARSEQPKDGVWVGEDSERYPCFDSSDYATENRYYHNFVFASTRAELEDKLAMLEKRKLLKGNYNKLYPEMHPIAYWEGDTYHPLYYTVRDQDI